MTADPWTSEQFPGFEAVWDQVEPFFRESKARCFALWQAINHVIDNDIPGAFVDCGVSGGGPAVLMALILRERGKRRKIFLFDSFGQSSDEGGDPADFAGPRATELPARSLRDDAAAPVTRLSHLDAVKQALKRTGYDPQLITCVVGEPGKTLPATQTLHVALLRVGTQSYEDTFASLANLYRRVSQGAPVLLDGYGRGDAPAKAVSDFFADPEMVTKAPMLWVIDSSMRGFVKVDPTTEVGIERYDYVPPGMPDPKLLGLFPFAEPVNPWRVKWKYLRPEVPHVFRSDTRSETPFLIGNASYEEAVCMFSIARQFKGRRGLEIGGHFAWTSAHLHAAGLNMDFVDPALTDPARDAAFRQVFDAIDSPEPYRLWPRYSPQDIAEVRRALPEPWSFVLIDGNHDGDAPAADARVVRENCAEDAVAVFHDMTSPDVARGLDVFFDAGWKVRVFNTMQILGVAWRGNVEIPEHVPDKNTPRMLPPHLKKFTA